MISSVKLSAAHLHSAPGPSPNLFSWLGLQREPSRHQSTDHLQVLLGPERRLLLDLLLSRHRGTGSFEQVPAHTGRVKVDELAEGDGTALERRPEGLGQVGGGENGSVVTTGPPVAKNLSKPGHLLDGSEVGQPVRRLKIATEFILETDLFFCLVELVKFSIQQ